MWSKTKTLSMVGFRPVAVTTLGDLHQPGAVADVDIAEAGTAPLELEEVDAGVLVAENSDRGELAAQRQPEGTGR
jgi:hypothetical protein